ncbi:MAG: N-acetylglucosamine kinase [Bacteroidia bacterium]
MILIADSGSTKTDWRFIDSQKKIHQAHSQGINPYFVSSEEINQILLKELIPSLPKEIINEKIEIYFYGAGCSSVEKCNDVKSAIQKVFKYADIIVEHDLLAAARALCGHKEGLAAILGTGTNSCYYNGIEIIQNQPSLGFILGDEGSGAFLGKKLICDFLNEEMPIDIAERIRERFKLTKDEVLENVYKKPFPSRYLASFSKFIYQNLKHEYCNQLAIDSFRLFFDRHICKYPRKGELPLGIVGSVGFYYSNIIARIADEKGIPMGKILESPIAGLTLYHLGED